MKLMGPAIAVAIAVAIGISCSAVTPATGPGTEWPCGYHARLCEISNLCCEDGSDCPGSYSCPMKSSDGQPHCCGHSNVVPNPTSPRPLAR